MEYGGHGQNQMKVNLSYLKKLVDADDIASVKRFVTLIISFHFIVTSFLVSFFVFYLILYIPRGTVNHELIDVLLKIFEYDFYIMISGLGFIAAENLGQILLEKAKLKFKDPDPEPEPEPEHPPV